MSEAQAELRKVLGRGDVLALAFGAMIGWGWVVLSGEMISRAGTVGSALAFLVGAVMVLLVGLTYAELTSALSRAGGELAFTFAGLGPNFSFLCGWSLVLAYLAVCAFEAVALPTVIRYLVPNFDVGLLYTVAGFDVYSSFVLVGVIGAILIGAVNYFGLRFASAFQWFATLILLLVGLSFFLPGAVQGEAANLVPLFTGWKGFLSVVIMTPFLFIGFDVIPQVAEEVKIPFSAVGRVIIFSIVLALAWYVLVQLTVGANLTAAEMTAGELATADAMSRVYGSNIAGKVLVFGGLLGIVSSWNAFFIGATRILFALSRAGMIPGVFAKLHPRHGSPVAAIVLLTALSIVAPFFGRRAMVWLVDAGGLATVFAFFLVAVTFLAMRRKFPMLPRPYAVRAPRVVGSLAVVTTLMFILLYLPGSPSALIWPHEWAIVIAWTAGGGVCWLLARGRVRALGSERQAELILGPYAEQLSPGQVPAAVPPAETVEAGAASS